MLNGDCVFCKPDCIGDFLHVDNDDIKNGDYDGFHDDAEDYELYQPLAYLEQPLDLRWSPDEQEQSDEYLVFPSHKLARHQHFLS